jgi:hypothetical protein
MRILIWWRVCRRQKGGKRDGGKGKKERKRRRREGRGKWVVRDE